jgi:hypothetical protein
MNLNIKTYCIKGLSYLHRLEKAVFEKYLLIGLASFGLLIGSSVYLVYNTCQKFHQEITKLQNLKKKTRKLLLDFASIDAEETRINGVLEQHKSFDLKIYFELFCKEQGVAAAPGWNALTTAINQQVDEISLTATFKGLTTESLVRMLQEFDKTEIVYLKNIRIKTDKDKKITCEVTLATIQKKTQG